MIGFASFLNNEPGNDADCYGRAVHYLSGVRRSCYEAKVKNEIVNVEIWHGQKAETIVTIRRLNSERDYKPSVYWSDWFASWIKETIRHSSYAVFVRLHRYSLRIEVLL